MKKFIFSLESVLGYKENVLDNLKNEHSIILKRIIDQEKVIEDLLSKYFEFCHKYDEEKKDFINIEKILSYDTYIDMLNKNIESQKEKLKKLYELEEKKRSEVILARQDYEAIVKLKDKKISEYKKDLQHEQEIIIEEFISNRRTCVI